MIRSTVLPLVLMLIISTPGVAEVPLPNLELTGLETGVEERLSAAREALVSALEGAEGGARGRLYGHTGQVFHAHHVFPIAEACYQNAAEIEPEEPLWPYLLGYIYEDTARFPEAKAKFERVLELDSAHPLATLRLARVLIGLGDIEPAGLLLQKVIDEPELAAPVHAALGKIATTQEDHAAAVQHFVAALDAQPQASQLQYPLALAYRHLGQIDKAREHTALAGQAKLVVPDEILAEVSSLSVSSQIFLTTGAQALKSKRFDLAEKAFRGAIAANPDSKRAHLNLAAVLLHEGQLDAAEASAREALRLDPEFGLALLNLGTIYDTRDQLTEATDFYRKALEQIPANVKLNFRLASVLMRTRDYEPAAKHFRKTVEISPSFVRARYLESLAWIALQRYDEARSVLEEAVKIHPEDPELSGSLARLLATSKACTRADADRALALAAKLDRNNPENVETLAMALAAGGRFDAAISAQQALLEVAQDQADPGFVQHLEYSLERYRQGLPNDRPWRVE